jgi:hypothetical protein
MGPVLRRRTEFASALGDLAAEPGQLQPVATVEIECHRGLHVGLHMSDQFENFLARGGGVERNDTHRCSTRR